MSNFIRIVVSTLMLVSILGGQLLADSYLKQVSHTDGFEMMGQKSPERNDTSVVWLTDGKSCCLTGSNESIIFDSEKGAVFIVNHNKKEYAEVPMDLFGAGEAKESESEELSEAQQMAKMMADAMTVSVVASDRTEKIGGWNASLYTVEVALMGMPSKQEIWATEDIEIDYEAFNAVANGMIGQMPGFEKIIAEMKKIKGIPVKTVSRASIMGKEVVSTSALIEYAEKDAPAGVYDVPADYKKVEVDMGAGMGMGN